MIGRLARAAAVLLVMGLAACDGPADPPPTLDPALWEDYSARFVEDGRVVDRDNAGITHTESQGYGMLLAEAADDREAFDALWTWARDTLSRPDGLLSWRWEPGAGVTDPNNATDGDMLVAWALLRAAERWDHAPYRDAALGLLELVREKALVEHDGGLYILPGLEGFRQEAGLVVNPSYWVFPALEAFAAADEAGADAWRRVADTGYDLIAAAGVAPTGLVSDWVILTDDGARPAPGFPPRFSWNAVRVPLHIAWTPDGHTELLRPYVDFWKTPAGAPPPPAWIDLETGETAEYGPPTGIRAIAALSTAVLENRLPESLPLPTAEDGYFSSSLALLTRLAVPGLGGPGA